MTADMSVLNRLKSLTRICFSFVWLVCMLEIQRSHSRKSVYELSDTLLQESVFVQSKCVEQCRASRENGSSSWQWGAHVLGFSVMRGDGSFFYFTTGPVTQHLLCRGLLLTQYWLRSKRHVIVYNIAL